MVQKKWQHFFPPLVKMLGTTNLLSSFKNVAHVPQNNLQQANLLYYTIFNNSLKHLHCTPQQEIQYTCVWGTNLSVCVSAGIKRSVEVYVLGVFVTVCLSDFKTSRYCF